MVARLTQDLWGKGLNLYIDNWYTSVALCMYLQERDMFVCGTVQPNRKGYPKELNDLKWDQAVKLGATMVLLLWHGRTTRLCIFCPQVHSPDKVSTIQWNQRLRETGIS